ncbi:O-antigen ligase family protein [Sphingomonas xinjiangensis]|uniref:MFS family permease n=1 Tax=Sphingomonas xinjiangensis TaxID=643568 RepID=A0A840YC92_9SPHN|nr:O-antigen ligase family protein [Sphingomonas xinjiangensis]MBB5710987.1 MFS family permease [Sphingomonas xinjiangensis]
MSSLSIAEPAARAPDAEAMRFLAMVPLLVYAVLGQLDAVGNRLSAHLPIGTTELTLAALLGATLLVCLLPEGPQRRVRGATGVRLIAMLFWWAVFSWTLSRHKDAGLSYLIQLGIAILPGLCTLIIVDRPGRLRLMLWAIIGAGTVSAVIVLIETRTGGRIVSTSIAATTAGFEGVARSAGGSDENPSTAAQMLLISVALALGLLFAGERRFRLPLLGFVAIGAAALVLGGARSAVLGLGAALALIVWRFRHRPFFPLLIVGGIVALIAAIPFLPPTLLDRFAAIGNFAQDQTLFRRITYLRIGADLIEHSPIWGVGPGNFPLYYVTDAYRWMPGREPFPRELHNTYLDAATEYGLVGFLIFAALLAYALLSATRATSALDPMLAACGYALSIALAALLVGCFFMPHKDLRYLWLLLALAIQAGRLRAAEGTSP